MHIVTDTTVQTGDAFVAVATSLGMDADAARNLDVELTAATDRVAALCAAGRLDEASALADELEAAFASQYGFLGDDL